MPDKPISKAARDRIRADIVLLAIGVAMLVWFTAPVLLLIFAGVLLAIAIDGLALLLMRWARAPRPLALVTVMVGLALAVVAGAVLVVPTFVQQVGQVWEQLSELMGEAREMLQGYPWAQQLLGIGEESGEQQPMSATDIAARVASATITAFAAGAAVIVMVAIGFFIAVNPELYRTGLLKLLPLGARPRAAEIMSTIGYALRWWLIGQLVSMLVLGTVTSLGLRLLGVEAWLGLGLLVAILTFVPFLGPIMGAVPVLVISFAEGLETGLLVLVFYVVLQNFEGNFLTPMVQQQAVHMPPALLISVQIVLATIFGFAGLMLAAPLAVVGMVVINHAYIEDVLGDRPAEI